MEIHSYNQELAIANTQFMRLFNNISVWRGNEETKFKCVIGNRSRIFKNLENPNKNGEYPLPLIIVQRTGISKNNDRLTNVYNEVKYATHSGQLNYNLFTPVPIDINYSVSIVSKRQGDIDKALSNFIPFFNKDVFVRFKHPKFEGLFMKCQVIMDDQIQEEHPENVDPQSDDLIVCTCTFLFKTWIFCGNDVVSSAKNSVRHVISSYPCPIWPGCNCDNCYNKDACLSGTVSTIVDTEYNGFIPVIRQVNVGFYPIPLLSDYIERMDFVDSLRPQGIDDHPYVDRLIWKIDELDNMISGQVGNSYHYPPFSSEYLSGYYDSRRTPEGEISGQLSTYNHLSGPDDAHKPWGPPPISVDAV